MDGLLNELSKSNVGCHIGGVLAGGFGKADDLKLFTPSISANICEKNTAKYDILLMERKGN